MPRKPLGYKAGFAIGSALIVIGLVMQLIVGAIDWKLLHAPANYVLLAVMCIVLVVLHLTSEQSRFVCFLTSAQAAVPSLFYATALTATMGLIRQQQGGGSAADVLGLTSMLTAWPFVLTYVWMTLIVGLVAVKQVAQIINKQKPWLRTLPSLLCHVGLFVALTAATLGSADIQKLRMICMKGKPQSYVVNEGGQLKKISVAIELKHFILETSEEGMPKRFASEVSVIEPSGKRTEATIDVNHPIEVKGWKIYQYGYDTMTGAESRISIFELVHDPWLPAVYVGIYLLLAGAVLMFLRK